jgi:hypothetical protein
MIPLGSFSQKGEAMKIREILSTPELRLRNIEKYVLSVYLKSIEVDEFIENNEDKVKHKK